MEPERCAGNAKNWGRVGSGMADSSVLFSCESFKLINGLSQFPIFEHAVEIMSESKCGFHYFYLKTIHINGI